MTDPHSKTDADLLAEINRKQSTRRKRSRHTTQHEIRIQSPNYNEQEARREPA